MRRVAPFTIHPEGYSILLTIALAGAVIAGVVYWRTGLSAGFYGVVFSTLLLLLFLTVFFRNPKRRYRVARDIIVAPADGRVVAIEQVNETEYFQKPMLKISIFMPPWTPHMNKAPITGIVKYVKYHPGRYLVAWHPKSSEENERNTVVFQRFDGIEVMVRQIAGYLARRVKCYVRPGDIVVQGQDFGFIRLGSRADVFLPLDAEVKVRLHERVKAGITELAVVPLRVSARAGVRKLLAEAIE